MSRSHGECVMTRKNSATVKMPSEIRKALGPPPLMAGEDLVAYDRLTDLVATSIRPTNAPEWLLIRDIVGYSWDLLRLRRLKADMVDVAVVDTLRKIVRGLCEHDHW